MGSSISSILTRWFGSSRLRHDFADSVAFQRRRVTFYIKLLFIMFASFIAMGAIKYGLLGDDLRQEYGGDLAAASILFAALAAGIGVAWWSLRSRELSPLAVGLHESVGTVAATGLLAALMYFAPHMLNVLGVVVTIIFMLVLRAAFVPSSALRTFVVGALATGCATVATIWWLSMHPPRDVFEEYLWAASLVWGLLFSAGTALVSRVIYGLQQRVREAMQLGNYTLEQKLGEGGMGVVYKARHSLLRRITAVKLLPPDKAGEEAVSRFEREVQETSALTHPNIIEIYDYGRTPEDVFYYAMEYLDGLDLSLLVEKYGRLEPGRVIFILAQAAHALAHAHDRGLVHRDVKPANIVLCDRGQMADTVKVLDFGLVKDLNAADVGASGVNSITGTPMFLAPESIRDPTKIDGRADIYALGAVGYFLLTGEDVFLAKSVVEVCGAHLHAEPVAPNERTGDTLCRDDLERVLLRCLAKEPGDRFPDGRALRTALLECQDASGWNLDRACAWWHRHRGEIETMHQKKAESIAAAHARTVAVDLAERARNAD